MSRDNVTTEKPKETGRPTNEASASIDGPGTTDQHAAPVVIPRASAIGRETLENTNLWICGEKGSGKTAWAEEVLLPNKRRLIVFDTLRKDYGQPDFCKAAGISYDRTLETLRELTDELTKTAQGSFRYVLRLPFDDMLTALRLFVYDEAKRRSVITDCTIVLEEISFYMQSNYIDPSLKNHLQYGRHNRNSLVGISRYPYEVQSLFRSQMDFIVSFRQSEERALKYFRDFDARAGELRELERGELLLMSGKEDELVKFIQEP